MNRRRFLALTVPVALAAPLLAACGGDGVEPAGGPIDTTPGDTTPGDTTPGDTTPATGAPAGGIEHPTGAEDVVVRLGDEGGFVPVGVAFINQPSVLITGDLRVIEPGAMAAIFPGPMIRPLFERTITEDGLQTLLALADENALLQDPPEYETNSMIADAPTTVVTLVAAGGTFSHRAYALGFDDEDDADRQTLNTFSQALRDLPGTVGEAELGEQQPYVGAQYRFMTMPVNIDDYASSEPSPEVRDWPADAPVRLADAAECALLDASDVETLLADTTEWTFFTDSDITYQLFVAHVLPGDAAC
jgi:hypothetical protein